MASGPPAPGGFLHSLRSFAAGLLASVHDRLELFAVEVEEQKSALVLMLVWISAIVFTAGMVVVFASVTLVYLFWESARLAVLGGLTGVHALVLVALVIAFRRHRTRQPKAFAATLRQLEEDRACIRAGS